jgi:hypothetical protein
VTHAGILAHDRPLTASTRSPFTLQYNPTGSSRLREIFLFVRALLLAASVDLLLTLRSIFTNI